MLKNILTTLISFVLLHQVVCNLVQTRNFLTASLSLFHAFVDVHDIQLGYPTVNKFGTICQTLPYSYSSIPIGVVPEIIGTLRSENGSAIGVWHNTNGCYVSPDSNDECLTSTFSHSLSECDNDIRLQLTVAHPGFAIINDLDDIQSLLDNLYKTLSQLEGLNKRSVVLSGPPKDAVLNQMLSLISTFKIQSRLCLEKIDLYMRRDIEGSHSKNESMMLQELYTSFQENWNLIVASSRNDTFARLETQISEHLNQVISMHNDVARQVTPSFWTSRWLMKNLLTHSLILSFAHLFRQLHIYHREANDCVNRLCEVQLLDEIHFPLSELVGNISISHHQCVSDVFSSVKNQYDKVPDSYLMIDIDYSIAQQVHLCALQLQKLVGIQLSFDPSQITSIPYSTTAEFETEEGYTSVLFLPRTSLSVAIDRDYSLVLDQRKLSGITLVELNAAYVETLQTPSPQPESIPPPSVTPIFKCPPGFYGEQCVECPKGTWSNDGYLHLCSNAPEGDTEYFVSKWPTPDCPFRCLNDKVRVNGTCRPPPSGHYPLSNKYESAPCKSDYPSNFTLFSSPGTTSKPYSCSTMVHHVIEFQYNMQSILENSFSIEIWMKLSLSDLLNVCLDSCDSTRFGVLDVGQLWSLYISIDEQKGRMRTIDESGELVNSESFELDGKWHHYIIRYDFQLRLIAFSRDSVPLGGGWYRPPKLNNEKLIVGGMRSDYPVPTRILPGFISKLNIHSMILPIETFSQVSSVNRGCTSKFWLKTKCVPFCGLDANAMNALQCSCSWGQYVNNETKTCTWCPSVTIGSRYPYSRIEDCICGPEYVWSSGTGSCVVGKPPLIAPEIKFIMGDTQEDVFPNGSGVLLTVNSTVFFSIPPQLSSGLSRTAVHSRQVDDIVLDVTITNGFVTLFQKGFPLQELPFSYQFSKEGQYRIEALFNQPGHLPGTKYAQVINVVPRAMEPFVLPKEKQLNGTTLLKIGSLEQSQHVVYYSLDGQNFLMYDKARPPICSPPVTVYMYTKSLTHLLPSPIIHVNYTWNTESESYKLFLALQSGNHNQVASNSTEVESKAKATLFVSWCQKSIPNCIIVFVVPIVSLLLIGVGLVLLLIIIRLIIKRRNKKKNPSSRDQLYMNARSSTAKDVACDEQYGDITCNVDNCKKLAAFFSWKHQLYTCNRCRRKLQTHPPEPFTRVMMCDRCKCKSNMLTVLKVKKHGYKYVCSPCLSGTPKDDYLVVDVVTACKQCKDEEVYGSDIICKHCRLLSNSAIQ